MHLSRDRKKSAPRLGNKENAAISFYRTLSTRKRTSKKLCLVDTMDTNDNDLKFNKICIYHKLKRKI